MSTSLLTFPYFWGDPIILNDVLLPHLQTTIFSESLCVCVTARAIWTKPGAEPPHTPGHVLGYPDPRNTGPGRYPPCLSFSRTTFYLWAQPLSTKSHSLLEEVFSNKSFVQSWLVILMELSINFLGISLFRVNHLFQMPKIKWNFKVVILAKVVKLLKLLNCFSCKLFCQVI